MKIFHTGGEQWILAFRNALPGWINMKLYSIGRVPNKANYWFGFKKASKKIVKRRDTNLLLKNRPELYASVLAYLISAYCE